MKHDVQVDGGELWAVMKTVGQLSGPNSPGEVVLTGNDGFLTLHHPGIVLELAASGVWDASVRVRTGEIAGLGSGPRMPGNVRVHVANGRLYVGGWSTLCLVKRLSGKAPLCLPMSPGSSLLVHLATIASPEEIAEAGLATRVLGAQAFRDAAVDRATARLARFGVKRDEVADLVEAAIQRKHAKDERFMRDPY
jgi:hypothetical protein